MVYCIKEMGKHSRLQERQEGGVGLLQGGSSENQPSGGDSLDGRSHRPDFCPPSQGLRRTGLLT